jgi:hypothetical protein
LLKSILEFPGPYHLSRIGQFHFKVSTTAFLVR